MCPFLFDKKIHERKSNQSLWTGLFGFGVKRSEGRQNDAQHPEYSGAEAKAAR